MYDVLSQSCFMQWNLYNLKLNDTMNVQNSMETENY